MKTRMTLMMTGVAAAALMAGLAVAEPAGEKPQRKHKDRPAATQPAEQGQRGQRWREAQAQKGEGEHGEQAQGERRGRDMAQRIVRAMFRDIELTDEQKVQVRDIVQEQAEHAEKHRQKVQALRQQMAEAREAGDQERIKELIAQAQEIMKDRPNIVEDTSEQLRSVLTTEQQAQFDANLADLRERIQQRMQEREGQPGQRMGERGNRDGMENGEGRGEKKGEMKGEKKGEKKGEMKRERKQDKGAQTQPAEQSQLDL